jgi:murein DD-endopeptidase MepM/ murein hydrolase activator NlpD
MYPIVHRLHEMLAELRRANKRGVGYGPRLDPFTKKMGHHDGFDLPCRVGVEIHAPWDGVVERVFDDPTRGGRSLVISHKEVKLKTGYAHLHEVMDDVVPGALVRRGQVVARSGISGRSTGAHLHFTVRMPIISASDWFKVDPLPFLEKAEVQEVIL